MLSVFSYFICMSQNNFGVMLFSLLAISSIGCLLFLDDISSHSLLFSSTPFLPLKVFGSVYRQNLGLGLDKLDPRATKCTFLSIPQSIMVIVVIVLFFDATSLVPMSRLLSVLHSLPLLILWVVLFLSLMSSPFHCLFPFWVCLSLSSLVADTLDCPTRSLCAALDHQLLHLHHCPFCLHIQCPCLFPILDYCSSER